MRDDVERCRKRFGSFGIASIVDAILVGLPNPDFLEHHEAGLIGRLTSGFGFFGSQSEPKTAKGRKDHFHLAVKFVLLKTSKNLSLLSLAGCRFRRRGFCAGLARNSVAKLKWFRTPSVLPVSVRPFLPELNLCNKYSSEARHFLHLSATFQMTKIRNRKLSKSAPAADDEPSSPDPVGDKVHSTKCFFAKIRNVASLLAFCLCVYVYIYYKMQYRPQKAKNPDSMCRHDEAACNFSNVFWNIYFLFFLYIVNKLFLSP